MTAIETDGLTKRYGDLEAISDVDLTVERGEIFGFLGPNGAGKSTTIDVLLDFIRPTAGRASVLDDDPQENPRAVREQIGILPDEYSLYDRLTGREHVVFAIEMNDAADDPDEILERVGLADAADQRAGDYSKGMGQRLALGMALVGDPDVLILDEPSSGIDPNGMHEIRTLLREEADRGATVFFSSHALEQVEAICDRVCVLDDGELLAVSTVENLRDSLDSRSVLVLTLDANPDPDLDLNDDHGLLELPDVTDVERTETALRIECADPGVKSAAISRVEDTGASVVDIDVEQASLEDLFAELTTDSTEGADPIETPGGERA
ncbi:ABC transporter [Natrialba hulunbeirensis JCM 10989]|uniref:ABC transporter n=1 Tax=Natrialba hulunbeirensis JCM 10989 TaxID=1227493 RepID=L9ZYG1_9EURY|nr:ABC transporter ATP-binding protein [Natrialba hulunbeirensis]ELY91359.1 ABC transporter [Natrialba hulunbeirensis JCM 10989]